MNFESNKKFTIAIVSIILIPLFFVFVEIGVQKEGLFVISTTISLVYLINIELNRESSNFIKLFLGLLFIFHIAFVTYVVKNVRIDFLDRSYTATGLGLSYFVISYFSVWIMRGLEKFIKSRS